MTPKNNKKVKPQKKEVKEKKARTPKKFKKLVEFMKTYGAA